MRLREVLEDEFKEYIKWMNGGMNDGKAKISHFYLYQFPGYR